MRSIAHPTWWMLILLGFAPVLNAQPPSAVCLNEFLASNATTLADSEGRYSDWIELYNPAPTPADVSGMFLTDDADEPARWRIPDGTIIPAGAFLLIWADGNADADALHAGFKLSAEGEQVALFDADGATLLDRVVFGPQRTDVSFGRYPDGASDWAFMTTPAPAAANAPPYHGVVSHVTFSVDRGFFDAPFTLALATDTPDARIWYTLDATTPCPNPDEAFTTQLYDEPIRIDRTTVVRAIATRPGWKDSEQTASTYLFPTDIQKQWYSPPQPPASNAPRRPGVAAPPQATDPPADLPLDPNLEAALRAIPSVCLAIEPNDFFDAKIGINANPMGRGLAWERPVSVEWIDPDDRISLQTNAGLRIHGGASRSTGTPKHSLRLLFKSDYGPSTLEAPLFSDTDVTQFDSLVLRTTLHDSWLGGYGQYLRDQFSRDTIRDMGRLTPHGCPVHVYINEQYWGLYILVERPDDGFAAAHLGGTKDQYDALKARSVSDPDPSPVEAVAGDLEAWKTIFALADAGVESQADYALACRYINVPSLIDYMLMVFYIGTTDGPAGLGTTGPRNFWAVYPRQAQGGLLFFAWDLEFSLSDLQENRVNVTGTNNPHYLFHRLATNEDFRISVADHVHRHFFRHGALTPQQVTARYLDRAAPLESALLAEAARWATDGEPDDAYSWQNNWKTQRDQLVTDYFPLRTDVVLDQLRQAGFYPSTEPPLLTVDGIELTAHPAPMGASLAIVNPNETGTIYYTTDGTDPRLSAVVTDASELVQLIPADAAKRVHVPTADIGADWTGGSEPYDDADWTAGTPTTPGGLGAVGYVSGRFPDQRVSYDLAGAMRGRTSCYIRIPFELTAEQCDSLPFLALRVQCDDGCVVYLNGTEVASFNRPDELAWNARCDDRSDAAPPVWLAVSATADLLHPGPNLLAIHALDSGRDNLFLFSTELFGGNRPFASGHVAHTAYEFVQPFALTRSTPIQARVRRAGAWSPLTEAVLSIGPVAENLRITELMYHPPEPDTEFVELANVGLETIDLNLVQITSGIDFAFGPFELAPGQTTVIVRDLDAFTRRYGFGPSVAGQYSGALSNEGESIHLRDALGHTIMDVHYDDRWYDSTDGSGHSLQSRDPFASDPNNASQADFWQPSPHPGGSPARLAD